MKLISTADTLEFLSKSAPRPWLKRMLPWMTFREELHLFATGGAVTPHTWLFAIRPDHLPNAKPVEEANVEIRERYGDVVADGIVGKFSGDRVDDESTKWSVGDEIQPVAPGVILFADEIDWDMGTIVADIDGELVDQISEYFRDNDLFSSQFHKPSFDVMFSGLCFDRDTIELLLPTIDSAMIPSKGGMLPTGQIGRPRKWDWEGALAHIVSIANKPDGLPSGDGAQARIEELLKDWFVSKTGNAPADSQIRERARNVRWSVSPKPTIKPF